MKGEDSEEGSLSGGSWQCSSLEAVRVKKREQSKSRKARLAVKKKKNRQNLVIHWMRATGQKALDSKAALEFLLKYRRNWEDWEV